MKEHYKRRLLLSVFFLSSVMGLSSQAWADRAVDFKHNPLVADRDKSDPTNEEVTITPKCNPSDAAIIEICKNKWDQVSSGGAFAITKGTELTISVDLKQAQYAVTSIKAGTKEIPFSQSKYSDTHYDATFIAEETTDLIITCEIPESNINVTITPPEGGTLTVSVNGVTKALSDLKAIKKNASIKFTCVANNGYSIKSLTANGKSLPVSDQRPSTQTTMTGKDMDVELVFLAPCSLAVTPDEGIESWTVKQRTGSWGYHAQYKEIDKEQLKQLKPNADLLLDFKPKAGYKIDKVTYTTATGSERELYYNPRNSGYPLEIKDNTIVKVTTKRIEVRKITIETPEGAPKIMIYKNGSTSYYWTNKEITDLSQIEVGTKIRIIIPKATKESMVDTFEIDGKPLEDYSIENDYATKDDYVALEVNADIIIKATFVKPVRVQYIEKIPSNENKTNTTFYDKATNKRINQFAKPNSELEVRVSPYHQVTVLRIARMQQGKEITLPMEKKKIPTAYGYGEDEVYVATITATEADNIVYVYAKDDKHKMHSVTVKGISEEDTAAGVRIDFSPEAFGENHQYPNELEVMATVTLPERYTLESLTANEGITLKKVEGEELVYSFTINGDVTLTAKFQKEIKKFAVKVAEIDAEAKAAGCAVVLTPNADTDGKYAENSKVTATITLAPDYKLIGISANDGVVLNKQSELVYTFVVKSDVTLTAKFQKEIKKFAVKVAEFDADAKAAGCAVVLTPNADTDGKYAENSKVTATITLAPDYKLIGISANDGVVLNKQSELVYTFVVKSDVTLTAKFQKEIKKFAVKVAEIDAEAKAAGCAIELYPKADTEGKYAENTPMAITVIVGKGYQLESIVVSDGSKLTERAKNVFTFYLKSNVTITVTFKKDTAVESLESSSVKLYPNPATNYVNWDGMKAFALVQLFALDGVEVKRFTTDATGHALLSLEGLAPGEYIAKSGAVVRRLLITK